MYQSKYIDTLSSWPSRDPLTLGTMLPVYVMLEAAMEGDLDQIDKILSSDAAPVDARSPDRGGTMLWYAAYLNHIELVKYLLEMGASPHEVNIEDNTTPLQAAIEAGNYNIARIINRSLCSS